MDLTGPGGTEHQRPSVPSALKHNLASVRLKAHVQHAVRLIQHPVRHPLQVDPDVLAEIQQGRSPSELSEAGCLRLNVRFSLIGNEPAFTTSLDQTIANSALNAGQHGSATEGRMNLVPTGSIVSSWRHPGRSGHFHCIPFSCNTEAEEMDG